MRSLTPIVSDDFYFDDKWVGRKAALTGLRWEEPG